MGGGTEEGNLGGEWVQNTSALWRALAATGTARLETVAVIDGQEYAAISAPVIRRGLTQEGLSVGNAVAASCQLSVLTEDAIPRAAEVVVRMRLSDGTQTSEWLPAGTFYVSHRSRDAVTGLLSLECYDAMLKANAMFPTGGAWPRSMAQVAADIAAALGVQMDARTALQTGDDFRILSPRAGSTVRDVLCDIASAHGGNWVLTKENKLRLVPLETPVAANAAQVPAVLGGVSAGAAQTVTGLRATGLDEEALVGTEAGLVIEIASPYVTSGTLSWLAGRLIGVRYQPFALSNAIYDPALELGDALRSKEDVLSALYGEAATLGLAFRGDISAPEPEELADEYPYVGTADRLAWLRGQVDRLDEEKADTTYVDAAETRANQVTAALNAALDQQGIFNRLTGNGAAQGIYLDNNGNLYINGSYIASGVLNANLIRAGMIADATGQNYWILDGNNSEFVTRKGVIGDFTLENGSLLYGSQAVGGTGAYIGKDGISYNTTLTDDPNTPQNLVKTEVFAQGIKMYWNNILRTIVEVCRSTGTGGFHVGTYDTQGNLHWPFQIWDDVTRVIYLRFFARCLEDFYVNGNVVFLQNLRVDGNLTVKGTKNRVVGTEQYSDRLLYAYETPAPMFGDVGEGVIAEDGRCHVWLDPIFAQTITTTQYQVFLQRYGSGDCWVAERGAGRFVVEGTPGLAFGWEIKARQREYDQRRLDVPIEEPEKDRNDYADKAAQYIERLHRGRMDLE